MNEEIPPTAVLMNPEYNFIPGVIGLPEELAQGPYYGPLVRFRILNDFRARGLPGYRGVLVGDEATMRSGENGRVVAMREQGGKLFMLVAPPETYRPIYGPVWPYEEPPKETQS